MQANLPALTQPADHPASNSVLGNYQDIPPRLLLLYCPIHLLCCWRVRRCPFCTAPAAATCPSSPLALLQGYTITDEGAVLFAAVAAAPPPRWPGNWLLGAVPFAAAPSRWPGYGLLGKVPFTALAAPRLRSSHWPGDGLLGIIAFAAAAALRLRPSCWSSAKLPAGGSALFHSRRAAA